MTPGVPTGMQSPEKSPPLWPEASSPGVPRSITTTVRPVRCNCSAVRDPDDPTADDSDVRRLTVRAHRKPSLANAPSELT
jgi:hypothetical protein